MSSPWSGLCRRPTRTDSWTKSAVKAAAMASHQGSRAQSHARVGDGRADERTSVIPHPGDIATTINSPVRSGDAHDAAPAGRLEEP